MEEEIKETNDDIEKDSETEEIENNNSEEGCVEEKNNAEIFSSECCFRCK